MLVFEERGKTGVPGEKPSRSRLENQQTQPTYDAESGNRTRATLVGGECSTTAPTLLPTLKGRGECKGDHFNICDCTSVYFLFL